MALALIVHGGAGNVAPERRPAAVAGCIAAARLGWDVLRQGGSALEAVIAATVALEDNPTFNAGRGAALTRDHTAELDAGLMDGATLQVGAALGLRRVKNPIRLAERVLASPEVLLAGAGAEAFAAEQGLELVAPEYFLQVAPPAVPEADRSALASLANPQEKHGTVGAVALDAQGHVAAAASTGGYAGKPAGRVGDTPLAGAGYYAEDGVGGVACTGAGEGFIRLLIARRVAEALERGTPAQDAADAAIALLGRRVNGRGGLIVVDAAGRVGLARNTEAMSYAYCTDALNDPSAGV